MIKHINFELLIWISALVSLAILNPEINSHFTLCPIKNLGFDFCPGCGLGHSISFLFHGDLFHSFQSHWFGIPAVIILLNRIYQLFRQQIRAFKQLSIKGEKYGERFSSTS